MEKSRCLRFQFPQEVGIVRLQTVYLTHLIACFPCVYDDGQIFVVGTQYELGKERYLVTVFAFGFHLVGERGAEVLQPFTVLPTVEQHLVHHDKELASPIGIELAAEIFVGVECYIVLEDGFQKIQECTLSCVAFFRYQQQDGQFLYGEQIEQLDIVQSQFVLFPEDMLHQ